MILDEILEKRKANYQLIENDYPLDKLIEDVKNYKFYDLFKRKNFIFITECKKASPSKGIISEDYPYLEIAKKYEEAGSDVISCLTEPNYFLGSVEHFKNIRKHTKCLMLRKDFIFSEYQIYESKKIGADVILLICSILTECQLKDFIDLTHSLGMCALVEAHDEKEIDMAIRCGAKVVGVNNRNLKDFTVDFENALNLRKKYPDIYMISESGVKTIEEVKKIKRAGLNGALIGEALMKSEDPYNELLKYRKASAMPKIKFCGIRRKEDIDYVNKLLPDYIGFVFVKSSRRKVTLTEALKLKKHLDPSIRVIGVFQNQSISFISKIVKAGAIDIVQLHGDEDDEYVRTLKDLLDIEVISVYRSSKYAEYVMYDSKEPGKGIKATYRNKAKTKPYFLAGGINITNIEDILLLNPYAIDISTGVEKDGVKDYNKMEEIIKKVRDYE